MKASPTNVRRLLAGSILIATLAGCGGGDGGSGGGNQDKVADMLIDAIRTTDDTEGITVDEDCVRDKVGELSDDDAKKILDAGPEGEPEGLSEEANGIGSSIFTDCVDIDFSAVTTD